MSLTQKDQLLEIGPGARLNNPSMREIERLTATNQSRQRAIGRKSKLSGIALGLRSPNKSSLYDVKQNRQRARKRAANL